MSLASGSEIENALQKLGELLALESQKYAIVVLGGAALNLLGIVERVTTDVDILAFAHSVGGKTMGLLEPPEPLPEPLVRAARTVARDLGLESEWLNTGPALQWRSGLPPGIEQRIRWRRYAALQVGLVDRFDLIFFKLYAAADSEGPGSVHYQDLLALKPNAEELDAAASWVKTQDASTHFHRVLQAVVNHVQADLGLDGTTGTESVR
jgi:hypothetical protein